MPKSPNPEKKTIPLPGWLLAAGMVLYCELILHSWITETIEPSRLAVVAGFALGCGALIGLILSHLPRKLHKITAIAVSVL